MKKRTRILIGFICSLILILAGISLFTVYIYQSFGWGGIVLFSALGLLIIGVIQGINAKR